MRLLKLSAWLLTITTAAAIAETPHVGDMTVYELPTFTLIAADNGQLRRNVPKLAQHRHAMEVALGTTVKSNGIPTVMIAVTHSVWDRHFSPSPSLTSEFVPTRFTNYVVADISQFGRGGLFHEFTHEFLYTQMPGAYPLWFDEGLAGMMARAQYPGRYARFDPSSDGDEGGWIPTERMLNVTRVSHEYVNQAELFSFHYQSRMMVHRALCDDQKFGEGVFKYLQALNDLQPIDESATKIFGMSLADLDFQMRSYFASSSKRFAKIDIGEVADLKLPVGRKMSDDEAMRALAQLSLDGGFSLDNTHELLDGSDKLSPGNLDTKLLRLRLAAQCGDDAALESLYAELTPRLADPRLARLAGLAWFERTRVTEKPLPVARNQAVMEDSLKLLDRALAANADDPQAVWAYATLAAALKRDLGTAMVRLVPMFERLPRNADMAMCAALIHEARGNTQDMVPALTAVYRYSHSFEQKRWAAARVAEIQKTTAQTGTH